MKNLSGLLVIGMLCFVSNFVSAQSQTHTAELIEDAYLQGSIGYNQDIIRLQQNYRRGFLKFNAGTIDGTITGVGLVLTIYSDTGDGTITVTKGTHSNWSESSLSSATAPTAATPLATRSSSGSGTHTYALDITDASIYSGIFTLRLDHTGSDDLSYASSEHTTTSIRPKLIITYTPDNPDPIVPTGSTCQNADPSDGLDPLSITVSDEQTANMACNIMDNNLSTMWSGFGEQSATFDLGGTMLFDQIQIAFYAGNARNYSFNIEISQNGTSWAPVGATLQSSGTSNDLENYSLVPQTARYLRYLGHGNSANMWNNITEFRILNSAGSGAGPGTGLWSQSTTSTSDIFYTTGNVGIGTSSPDEALTVGGKIHAEEVRVDLSVPAPDYVFKPNYELRTLKEVQQYIKENGHLPNIPSALQMETHGVELGTMDMRLLEKIEELTLYVLELERRSLEQKKRIIQLEQRTSNK